MKQNPTMADVKRIWDITKGYYIFDEDERMRQWRLFKKQAKKDFESVDALYEFMCNATGRV